jgi:hypothetical protein
MVIGSAKVINPPTHKIANDPPVRIIPTHITNQPGTKDARNKQTHRHPRPIGPSRTSRDIRIFPQALSSSSVPAPAAGTTSRGNVPLPIWPTIEKTTDPRCSPVPFLGVSTAPERHLEHHRLAPRIVHTLHFSGSVPLLDRKRTDRGGLRSGEGEDTGRKQPSHPIRLFAARS